MAKKEAKAKKETNTKKENNSKNKKSFFKDFKAELKRVNWPTPKQLLNNTTAVITIVLITAAIVFVLDVVFETLNKHGVDKIKEVITTNETTENTENNSTVVENEEEDAVEENAEASNEQDSAENVEASNEENNTENNAE